jgi:uncharacterized protein
VAAYFLDTSTVLKRYVQETGTAWVQALAAPTVRHSLFVVRITLAETVAAITRGCDRASAKDFHEIRAVFTRGVA